MIKEWMEEYLSSERGRLYTTDTHNFIIYKGFKIIEWFETSTFEIVDVRLNDFYDEVSDSDIATFKCYGFVKGADLLMYHRDLLRIGRSRTALEKAYQDKEDLEKIKDKLTPRKYIVKQEGIVGSIQYHTDRMFFYETRTKQTQIKYQIEVNE